MKLKIHWVNSTGYTEKEYIYGSYFNFIIYDNLENNLESYTLYYDPNRNTHENRIALGNFKTVEEAKRCAERFYKLLNLFK